MFSNYETSYTNAGMNRSYSHEKKLVEPDYDLNMTIVQKYIETNELQGGVLHTNVEEFLSDKIDVRKIRFSSFLQSLIDNDKITENKELYASLKAFNEYAHKNNEMHKDRVEHYDKLMKKELFKNNAAAKGKEEEEYEQIDYSKYEYNNFRKTDTNLIINFIYLIGGTIYLDSSAEICFRQNNKSKIEPYAKKKLETLIGTMIGHKIKITEESTQNFTSEEEQEYKRKNEDVKVAINNKLLEGGK